jgi:methanogenic corrinoid protein MtbC1
MHQSTRHLGDAIERVSGALAQWIVEAHVERDPTLALRYGDGWRSAWVAEVRQRLRVLAQALTLGRPEILARALAWSQETLASRSMDQADLATSLDCTRQALAAELPEAAGRPALICLDEAAAQVEGSLPAAPAAIEQPHAELCLAYLEALLEGQPRRAQELVMDAAEGGLSVKVLHEHVLAPAQVEVGRMWHAGEISVAEEHLVTAATERMLSMLRRYFPAVAPRHRRVLASCVAGELHCLGVRMVADAFEMDGWDVIYLGANTPTADLIDALRQQHPDVLALSVSSFVPLGALASLIEEVRRTPGLERIALIVGGAPFLAIPGLWRDLGADGFGANAADAVKAANRLRP